MQLGDLTVYHDGRFMRYDDAKVGLLTHGLQYGTGCFEGVRALQKPRTPSKQPVPYCRPCVSRPTFASS